MTFLVLAVIGSGCSRITELANSGTNSPGTNSSNSGTAGTKDAPAVSVHKPSGDPRKDIEQLADRFLAVPSFRAVMTSEGETPMDATLEFVSPDRFRMQNKGGFEIILIGKESYMKIGDRWQKTPMLSDASITGIRAAWDENGRKWFSDVVYQGEETVDGRGAHVYTFRNADPETAEGKNDSKIWIAKDDGLPIKLEAVYLTGSLKKMLIKYDFKTPVTIEAPAQ
ncbi:MAG: hypothetical protein IPM25_13120 [Chloracidobacterium sp.]|nr:hypothetical protein [Chloracidobacterium sp.]